jgi:uncharacterized membrane protein
MEKQMPSDLIVYACLATGISSALVAGVFLSFSDFVMASLIAARSTDGIEAMQMINRKVFRSVFLVMLLGMGPVSLAFALYAHLYLTGAAYGWIIAGTLIYLIGVIGVTIFCNVPMNKRLDGMALSDDQTADYWKIYGSLWTRWNHVGTFGSLATAICFLLASVGLA